MSNEIITIQAGSLANHVFVHFWKYHEYELLKSQVTESPFLSDVLYQLRLPAVLSSPRLLSIDLRETVNFGLDFDLSNFSNSFYNLSSWNGNSVTVMRSQDANSFSSSVEPHSFDKNNWLNCLSLNSRNSWCENDILLKIPKMNKSNNDIQSLISSSPNSLSTFTEGLNIFNSGSVVFEEAHDRIRRLAEPCSHPSAFYLTINAEDAFSGVGLQMIEIISEEYAKQTLFTVPVYNSSLIRLLDKRLQRIAASNQLCLANALESSDFTTHGVWMPLDVTSKLNMCDQLSFIAGAFDCVMTPAYVNFGSNVDSLLQGMEFSEGRKMMSLRSGLFDSDIYSYHNLNPYSKYPAKCNSVLSRKLAFRGIPDPDWIDSFIRSVSSSNSPTELSHSIPTLSQQREALVKTLCSLPKYPLQVDSCALAHSRCQQSDSPKRQWAMLDIPDRGSAESCGLGSLVKSCQQWSNQPPDDQMEFDLWKEALEVGQIKLNEAYCHSSG